MSSNQQNDQWSWSWSDSNDTIIFFSFSCLFSHLVRRSGKSQWIAGVFTILSSIRKEEKIFQFRYRLLHITFCHLRHRLFHPKSCNNTLWSNVFAPRKATFKSHPVMKSRYAQVVTLLLPLPSATWSNIIIIIFFLFPLTQLQGIHTIITSSFSPSWLQMRKI